MNIGGVSKIPTPPMFYTCCLELLNAFILYEFPFKVKF